jgi:hypothetical protein
MLGLSKTLVNGDCLFSSDLMLSIRKKGGKNGKKIKVQGGKE